MANALVSEYVWNQSDPIDTLTLNSDWDYMISSLRSLQIHWSQFKVVPVWNFMFCGGRPELANPQSFAFTWYSPLLYPFQPFAAFLILWALLSAVGGTAIFLLARQFGSSKIGAALTASCWCFNGYFASHFTTGHMMFAFMHLVPLVLLLCNHLFESPEEESSPRFRWKLAFIALGTFAFSTTGLPETLYYVFPAILLFFMAKWTFGRIERKTELCRRVGMAFTAVISGLILSAYKLLPVLIWQVRNPRAGVVSEQTPIKEIFARSVGFIKDYDNLFLSLFDKQTLCLWEYNWFVGLPIWTLAVLGAGVLLTRRGREGVGSISGAKSVGMWLLSLFVLGIWLSLGNEHPAGIARFFKFLPLIKEIRVFPRYTILAVMALALAGGIGLTSIERWMQTRLPRHWQGISWGQGLSIGLLLAAISPGIFQTLVLVKHIQSFRQSDVEAYVGLPKNDALLMYGIHPGDSGIGRSYHDFLLRQGYWIPECYDSMTLLHPPTDKQKTALIASPMPEYYALTPASITFGFPAKLTTEVALRLATYPLTLFSAGMQKQGNGTWTAPAADMAGKSVTISQPVGDTQMGFVVSFLGIFCTATVCRKRGRKKLP